MSATVVQQTLRTQLRDRLKHGKDADQIVKKVQESLEYIRTLEPETREVVRECYAAATRHGFGLMLGLASIAMLGSCMFNLLDEIQPELTIDFRVHERETARQIASLWTHS